MSNVKFVFLDGRKASMPVKEAVIREARCEGTIEGGRPPFEEVKKVSKKKKED